MMLWTKNFVYQEWKYLTYFWVHYFTVFFNIVFIHTEIFIIWFHLLMYFVFINIKTTLACFWNVQLSWLLQYQFSLLCFLFLLAIFPPPCSLWQNIECWSISGWSESDRGRPPPPPAKPNQLVSRVWNILSSGHFYFWKWEIILYYMNIYLISLKKGKVWGKFQNRLDPSPQIYLKLSNFQKILPPPPTWIKVRIFLNWKHLNPNLRTNPLRATSITLIKGTG